MTKPDSQTTIKEHLNAIRSKLELAEQSNSEALEHLATLEAKLNAPMRSAEDDFEEAVIDLLGPHALSGDKMSNAQTTTNHIELIRAYIEGYRGYRDAPAFDLCVDHEVNKRIEELTDENERLGNAIKIQANAVKTMRSCEAQIANHRLRRAEQIMHECDPSNIESEKEMNAILTDENERLLAANRDIQLHWDVLKADYDRLSAQVAAADGMREAIVNLTGNCVLYIDHYLGGDQNRDDQNDANDFLREFINASNKSITAYDNAKAKC